MNCFCLEIWHCHCFWKGNGWILIITSILPLCYQVKVDNNRICDLGIELWFSKCRDTSIQNLLARIILKTEFSFFHGRRHKVPLVLYLHAHMFPSTISSLFASVGESGSTQWHYPVKSMVQTRGHHRHCEFYGVWKICRALYVPLWFHTEPQHDMRILCPVSSGFRGSALHLLIYTKSHSISF